MNHYTLELNTVHEIADSDFLDRLADLVYDIDELISPVLALNDDGSVTASFEIVGADPLAASQGAIAKFLDAVTAAEPLRSPTEAEVSHGLGEVAQAAATALEGFAVAPAADREPALS